MKIKQAFIVSSCFMLMLFSACTTNTSKKKGSNSGSSDTSSGQQALPAVKDQSELLRKLLKAQHIYPFYVVPSPESKDTYVVLYQQSSEKKAPEDIYFYTEEELFFYAAKVQLINDKEVRLTSKKLVMQEESTYCTIDSTVNNVKIANKDYISLVYRKEFKGTAIVEKFIDFQLIDLSSLDSYTLGFEGVYSFKCKECLEGRLTNEKKLAGKPELLAFLKGMVAKSPHVYHPSEKDKDPYHVLNYEIKWEKDNQASNHMANGHGELELPVKTTYYHTNLFNLDQGSEVETAENEQYLFKSFFCGSVIGFDKQKKLYFPVMIESCNGFCSKNISINAGVLKISYEDEVSYEVPLADLVFDKQKEK